MGTQGAGSTRSRRSGAIHQQERSSISGLGASRSSMQTRDRAKDSEAISTEFRRLAGAPSTRTCSPPCYTCAQSGLRVGHALYRKAGDVKRTPRSLCCRGLAEPSVRIADDPPGEPSADASAFLGPNHQKRRKSLQISGMRVFGQADCVRPIERVLFR